ncbi:protein POOR HOMOLOGOUS SYNAPSIS 1 [Phalaenopsis equestris]|uniref:protein POOR HOMOLOGOUS SYNAPSIS 1 n=1 Tax=Phalaenopsis equestris TaxID=78828 RepID=UPI0009E1D14B|nr:protein POOR HOMOLOGOUS SYNAPSIS 1 [Phalaenopsis equestris]
MAEATSFPSIPPLATLSSAGPLTLKGKWEGEFSRFFVIPRRQSGTVDNVLRQPSNCAVLNNRGTWLTASSTATILIVKASSSNDSVLSISVSGYVHEEHIVSSLNLTWPQVHCVPQWPIRGSRLVFMSYRDCSNQIQKFAVRFSTCANAETFVCYFKACSSDNMNFTHPANYFLCDSSSPSEMIASNALQHKFNDGESYEEAITRDMPSPVFSQNEIHHPSLLVNSSNAIVSSFPPSFTEQLTNCSKYPPHEISKQLEESDHTLGSGESAMHLSPQHVTEQLLEGVDLFLLVDRCLLLFIFGSVKPLLPVEKIL